MKHVIALIILITAALQAAEGPVDLGTVSSDGDWLAYDDGNPGWYTWGGTYRGQWFNIQDFIPGMQDGWICSSRVWFYHEEAGHTWDTSDVYIEIWNGDAMGPVTQITQDITTAYDYAPSYVNYTPGTSNVEQNFWCLVNTEMSAGGWPSTLGDNQNGAVAHSFYSDDFLIWEPWGPAGNCYYLIAVEFDTPPWQFQNTTWASLKSSF